MFKKSFVLLSPCLEPALLNALTSVEQDPVLRTFSSECSGCKGCNSACQETLLSCSGSEQDSCLDLTKVKEFRKASTISLRCLIWISLAFDRGKRPDLSVIHVPISNFLLRVSLRVILDLYGSGRYLQQEDKGPGE